MNRTTIHGTAASQTIKHAASWEPEQTLSTYGLIREGAATLGGAGAGAALGYATRLGAGRGAAVGGVLGFVVGCAWAMYSPAYEVTLPDPAPQRITW